MAKYEQPFEETTDLFSELIVKTKLDQVMTITIIVDNKLKKITNVTKGSPLLKYRAGDDIVIFLNENIFEQLTELQRHIVVEEALANIHYDSEKDKIIITKPDVVTYSGVLSKYTYETWNILSETIKTLYNVEKQAEDESSSITK
jgi:hypothetical protein